MLIWQDSGRFKRNSLFFESFALEQLALLRFSAGSLKSQVQFLKTALMTSKVERRASLVGLSNGSESTKGFSWISSHQQGLLYMFFLKSSISTVSLVLQQSGSSDRHAGNYAWRDRCFRIKPYFFCLLQGHAFPLFRYHIPLPFFFAMQFPYPQGFCLYHQVPGGHQL